MLSLCCLKNERQKQVFGHLVIFQKNHRCCLRIYLKPTKEYIIGKSFMCYLQSLWTKPLYAASNMLKRTKLAGKLCHNTWNEFF